MAGILGWRTGPEFYFPTGPQAVAPFSQELELPYEENMG
jgi:hypothetical protein